MTVSKPVMDSAVPTYRGGIEFANANITEQASHNQPIRDLMKTYGPRGANIAPLTFQIDPSATSTTGTLTLAAAGYGACSVELL